MQLQRRELDERTAMAWRIEELRRRKKLPELRTLLIVKPSRRSRRQTWQQQLAILETW